MERPGRSRLSWAFDVTLAAAIAAAGLLEIWVPFSSRQGTGSGAASSVASVLVCAPLVWRRVRPLAAQSAQVGGLAVVALAGPPMYVLFFGTFLPLGVAVFATARYGPGRTPYLGAALAAATLLTVDLTVPELQAPGEIVFHWGVFTMTWLAGYALAVLDRRSREATERAIRVEVAAAEETLKALADERGRISRELHDIVAHAVSMIVVQAGAAELVVRDDPDRAERALRTIRATGADALAEMRRLVGMLRDDDEGARLQPQPGLDALPALVEDIRASGIEADLAVEGEARPLPVGLDLAAYRIVQEALTNVRRHSAASRVRVRLSYGADSLGIEVADDGVGARPGEPGHGLAGMRERAALYGGSVETESRDGFTVRAVLPVAPG